MKIAVLGANGQLGSDVCAAFEKHGDSVVKLTHADIEISSKVSVDSVLDGIEPDLVVNTVAMHHVEKCEADPSGSFIVNGIGARNVAQWTCEHGAFSLISVQTTSSAGIGIPLTWKRICPHR